MVNLMAAERRLQEAPWDGDIDAFAPLLRPRVVGAGGLCSGRLRGFAVFDKPHSRARVGCELAPAM